jgi:hypothetical protein
MQQTQTKPEKVCKSGVIIGKTLWGVRESDGKDFRSSNVVGVNGDRVETQNTIYIVKEFLKMVQG